LADASKPIGPSVTRNARARQLGRRARRKLRLGVDCETLQLQALDDACGERNALQAPLERER
jgi:hypothetical protein